MDDPDIYLSCAAFETNESAEMLTGMVIQGIHRCLELASIYPWDRCGKVPRVLGVRVET